MVCQSLGLNTHDYSLGYVAEWKNGDAEKVRDQITVSGARIQSVGKKILDSLEAQAERPIELETGDGPESVAQDQAEDRDFEMA